MTRSNERRQVLDMLATGKISADEAQRLLERLEGEEIANEPISTRTPGTKKANSKATSPSGGMTTAAVLVSPQPGGQSQMGKTRPRYLRILISDPEGEEINIRIPLQFIRAGVKLVAMLPTEARQQIQASGVDLSKLNELEGDALIDALRELAIKVDSSDGKTLRIFCE